MTAPSGPQSSATVTALKAIRPPDVPQEKWERKLMRVVIGVLFIVGGVLFKTKLGAPWQVAAVGCALGTHIWAGEVINRTLITLPKLVGTAIVDVLGAIQQSKKP